MKKDGPLISVIVPVYNMAYHLERCIQSILRQTYKNMEILLIDDGSTDNSLEIMRLYEEIDLRICVHQKDNGGVSSARNLGLRKMRGEYFTFIDPDDYVADRYIEWLYSAISRTGTDLAICNGKVVTDGEIVKDVIRRAEPTIIRISIEKYSLWDEASHAVCWGALYKTASFQDLQFDEQIFLGEDVLFFFQALHKCTALTFIREQPYYYVQYENSASKGRYTPSKWTEIQAWQKICALARDLPIPLRQSAEAWYVMTCAKILTWMTHSKYNDAKKAEYLLREIRRNLDAVRSIPEHKRINKIHLIAYAVFPRLIGFIQWKYYLRKKIAQI